MQLTYHQPIKPTPFIFEMTKEAASIYNKALDLSSQNKTFKEISKIIDKCNTNLYLHSQSSQAAYQLWMQNMKSYFASIKQYNKAPSKFNNKPEPPKHEKFMQPVTFKKSAIRYKNGYLYLSVKKPNEPIQIKWNDNLPIPEWASISYSNKTGWNVNLIVEKEIEKSEHLDSEKIMSIDLGVKRVATTFDGENCITYSGKELMSLVRLKNKINDKTKSKLSKYKKGSRKYKKIKRSNRNVARRLDNKQKDILHKTSRTIVNDAIDNKIGTIVIGDCSSIHNKTKCGDQNQKIQQYPEQKLRKYVEYKFQSVGGSTEVPSERNTTKTCPMCKYMHKPNNRTFKCPNCGFVYDRDGVGAVNIYRLKVSLSDEEFLNVVGRLTRPRGWKYHSMAKCISPLNEKSFSIVHATARSRCA